MWSRKISSSPISMTGSSGLLEQHVRVAVEDVAAEEDHQVAGDVDDEVKEKCEAGDADQDLRADRRTKTRTRVAMTIIRMRRTVVLLRQR